MIRKKGLPILGWFIQVVGHFEEMREQHKNVDESFISNSPYFEVFEEDVDAEELKSLIDNVLLVLSLETLIGLAFQFGPEWN